MSYAAVIQEASQKRLENDVRYKRVQAKRLTEIKAEMKAADAMDRKRIDWEEWVDFMREAGPSMTASEMARHISIESGFHAGVDYVRDIAKKHGVVLKSGMR